MASRDGTVTVAVVTCAILEDRLACTCNLKFHWGFREIPIHSAHPTTLPSILISKEFSDAKFIWIWSGLSPQKWMRFDDMARLRECICLLPPIRLSHQQLTRVHLGCYPSKHRQKHPVQTSAAWHIYWLPCNLYSWQNPRKAWQNKCGKHNLLQWSAVRVTP